MSLSQNNENQKAADPSTLVARGNRIKTVFTDIRNCNLDAMLDKGWNDISDKSKADLVWIRNIYFTSDVILSPHQRANHFRRAREVGIHDCVS